MRSDLSPIEVGILRNIVKAERELARTEQEMRVAERRYERALEAAAAAGLTPEDFEALTEPSHPARLMEWRR